jgi:hypothetical protein
MKGEIYQRHRSNHQRVIEVKVFKVNKSMGLIWFKIYAHRKMKQGAWLFSSSIACTIVKKRTLTKREEHTPKC